VARLSSVVAPIAVPDFAAEHPVGQPRVEKDDWQDNHDADEHENLARAGAEAAQMLKVGGTMFGKMLISRPL